MSKYIAEAISSLRPGALWALHDGTDISTLEWLDPTQTRPTDSAIAAEAARLSVAWSTPQAVTPRQARLALLAAGLLDQVEAAVTASGGQTKIAWEYATQINRTDGLIIQIAARLTPPLTPTQIDALFAAAAKL